MKAQPGIINMVGVGCMCVRACVRACVCAYVLVFDGCVCAGVHVCMRVYHSVCGINYLTGLSNVGNKKYEKVTEKKTQHFKVKSTYN